MQPHRQCDFSELTVNSNSFFTEWNTTLFFNITDATTSKQYGGFSVKCKINFEKASPVFEVDRAEGIRKSSTKDLQVWRPMPDS
jgi:hypothetical protein